MKPIPIAACALLSTFGFGNTLAVAADAPVQPNYAAVSTDLDKNGNLVVVAWLYPLGGQTAVCGFYFPEKQSTALAASADKLLGNLKFEADGKRLKVSAGDFTEYADEAEAKAVSKGRCVPTNLAWDSGYAQAKLDIGMKNRTIRD
ncbi:MAG: hypothetical protein ACKVPY_02560 [Paracoccaceae bacterium]